MRIVMDLQGAQSESRFRGIGRYTLSLATAVASRNRGHEIVIALNSAFPESVSAIRKHLGDLVRPENFHVWHTPLPANAQDADPKAQLRRNVSELIREAALASLKPDVLHLSSLFEGYGDDAATSLGRLGRIPTVVTFYDLIPFMNPDVYLNPNPRYRASYMERIAYVREADALLAISETSAAEAVEQLGIDPGRVFTILAGCDEHFQPLAADAPMRQAARERFGLDGDFILYTGGADERKNLRRLIRAYASLREDVRQGGRLVLAGKMPEPIVADLKNFAALSGLEPAQLVFTGYVTEDELVGLYNECQLFVFPSWHEGFGLPALEAMACGAPVLASGASSIKEVVSEPSAWFDPFDENSISERMQHYLSDPEERERLKGYSMKRAGDFSWARVADAFLDACEVMHARQSADVAAPDGLPSAIDAIRRLSIDDDALLKEIADCLDRSCVPYERQLLIDVTELARQDLRTGIQRVTRAVVAQWAKSPPPGYRLQLVRIDPVHATYVGANHYAAHLLGIDIEEDRPIVCHAGDVFLGLDLVGNCVIVAPEFFDHLKSVGATIAFVVYDILPIRHPEWWPGEGGLHHERWLRDVLRVADRIICISKAVADDVQALSVERGVFSTAKIDWFHLGADTDNTMPSTGLPPDADEVLSKIAEDKSFLMVGTLEPRKGHKQALDAFELLWAQGHELNLVIVGKQGWMVDELCERLRTHPQLGTRLFWLSNASDEYLDAIYRAASVLLVASFGEGFGLPIVEGSKRALPVLARDLPVFREVGGDSTMFFEAEDPPALADALLACVLREDPLLADGQHEPWISWEKSCAQLQVALLGAERPHPQNQTIGDSTK